MTTGAKVLAAAIVIAILVAAPTQAAGLVSDLVAGVVSFFGALG